MDPLRLDVVVFPELGVNPLEAGAVLRDDRVVVWRDSPGDQAEEQVQIAVSFVQIHIIIYRWIPFLLSLCLQSLSLFSRFPFGVDASWHELQEVIVLIEVDAQLSLPSLEFLL